MPELRHRTSLAVAFALLLGPVAIATPADPFANALPTDDTKPPEGVTLGGDPSVASTQGAAKYAFPIEVPPGRAGMQPRLTLSYSSDSPLRGGVAAGWTLAGLPTIERDPTSPAVVAYKYGGEPIVDAPGDLG